MVEDTSVDLGITGLAPAVRIGSGGFADVYRARQFNFNREVAVKVLRAAAGDEQARIRFERECHALGAVSGHPNIVGVHEGGFTADGRAYLVMEFCPGGSLSDRVARSGPLSPAEVIDIGIKIGRALGVAHRAGVVHRDVKPGNILMTAFGEPALADFGIARVEGGQHTATGTVTASLAHAAPEVLEGATPSPGSDIYSLGSTLFELFVGHPPHFRPADESVWALMRRVLSEPIPDPTRFGMPEPLAASVVRATARHAADRFAQAEDLVAALSAAPVAPAPARPAPPVVVTPTGSPPYQPVVSGPQPGAGPWDRPSRNVHDTTQDPTVMARSGTWELPDGGSGAASGPPPIHSPSPSRRGRPWLFAVAGLVAVVVSAGLTYALVRPDGGETAGGGGTDDTTAESVIGDPAEVSTEAGELRFSLPQALVGPLDRGQAYPLTVSGGAEGALYQLLVDGSPVGSPVPAESLTRYIPSEAGRQSLVVQAAGIDGEVTSETIEAYVIGPVPAAGFRVNLLSYKADPENWSATLAQFDRLVAEGHTGLQLLPSDRFASLRSGFWNLFVAGFPDVEAGRAYCVSFDLAVPDQCFASRFDPGGA